MVCVNRGIIINNVSFPVQEDSVGVAQQVVASFLDALQNEAGYEATAKALAWVAVADQKPTDTLLRRALFESGETP
jgi:hypothetical protein